MSKRSKISDQMRTYLEDRINCENVIKFIKKTITEQMKQTDDLVIHHKLVIDSIPVSIDIISYDDTNTSEKIPNRRWILEQFQIYDFITESNYTGFEYFPYLYGVLECRQKENSFLYVFYEFFEGDLLQLINQIEHPSEWYDIVFQLIIINYYIENMYHYQYNGALENHFYRKLEKPVYQEYVFGNYKFNINHKYLVVLWNLTYLKKITDDSQIKRNTEILLAYLEKNKAQFRIPPSSRIIKLLHEIRDNPDNVLDILGQYYPS